MKQNKFNIVWIWLGTQQIDKGQDKIFFQNILESI